MIDTRPLAKVVHKVNIPLLSLREIFTNLRHCRRRKINVSPWFDKRGIKQKQQEKRKPGRPAKLTLEDQVLLTLQYWREYRTYFHIAQGWNINESTAFRIVRHVEQTLIRSGQFRLPGKKALVQSDCVLEVVVVDVTESPVERPEKNNDRCFPARNGSIP